jgi:D-alanyl-D-alanine carboxypeptidase/D-alanyl-D-alanine-endopeptidase (penicillin-binding protein 4)
MKRFLCVIIFLFSSPFAGAQSPTLTDKPSTPEDENRSVVSELQAVIADPRLQGAVISARVDTITAGQTIFAHQPDALVNPASVSKIFTTAAALSLLHPDYRFKTEVYLVGKPINGVVHGPIYLKGYGDPSLVTEKLLSLTMELRALGLRRVEGPLIVDDRFFDEVEQGPGFGQDHSSHAYMAPTGAVSLNFNTVSIVTSPGEKPGAPARVALFPDSEYLTLFSTVTTAARLTRLRAEVELAGERSRITVNGWINPAEAATRDFCRILHPARYAGFTFRELLKQHGVHITGPVQRGSVPVGAEPYYTLFSESLGELARTVNKVSQNFMAEQLWKTLGAEFFGSPGSWWRGQQVMNSFLEEVGIPTGSYVLHNGSGLNDTNRVTSSQVVALLRYMWDRHDVQPDFLASLAVAGADGTVAGRFTQPLLIRSMRLKTGTLSNTRTLAGYVFSRGKEVFVFSLLIARFNCSSSDIRELIDRFATALALADANRQIPRSQAD